MSNTKQTAVKAGIGYTVGNILIKGISFMTLPVFSRLLTTEQFGVYNVFVSYEAILYVVVGMALHASVRSANLEFKGKIDEYTSSVSLIYIFNAVLFLLAALVFGGPLSRLLSFKRGIMVLLVLDSFGSAVLTLYNNRISLAYAYNKYMAAALCNSLGNVGLSLILMFTVFRDKRDTARILGTTLTLFVISLVILGVFYRKAKPAYNREYWKFGIKYSLPIVPHGISQVLLAQFDRIMIRSMVSDAAAGIYSLAGNVQLVLTVLTDSIATVWSTWFYQKMDANDTKDIQRRAFQLCRMFAALCVGMIAIAPEMIWILGGKQYEQATYVAVPLIMVSFVLFVYNVVVDAEYYSQKTTYIMYCTLAAAIIDIVLNLFFVSRFGFVAAAYTTLTSYIFYLIFHMQLSRKLLGFAIMRWSQVLTLGMAVVLAAVISLLLRQNILLRYLLELVLFAVVGGKAAVQEVQENYADQPHVEAQVAMLIANQAADNDNQVSIQQVRQQLEEEYPLAAVPFDDYVEKSDVLEAPEQPVTVTPARIRRMESRSIHTANGIEVKIPTELLNSDNEVEFLHSDDGSISLLIKNVIL